MTQQHKFGAVPLFAQRGDLVVLDLVSLEETETVDEDPGQRTTEVDEFVHGEGHDAGGQNIVLHPGIPGGPELLGHIELAVQFRDFLVLAPVGARGQCGRVPGEVSRLDEGDEDKARTLCFPGREGERKKKRENEVEVTRRLKIQHPK